MTGVALQFHATNSEVVAMATEWVREFSLHAGLGTYFAEQAVAVQNGDFGKALAIVPAPDFLILGTQPLLLPKGADLYRLKGMNHDYFVVQLGQRSDTDLRETFMAGVGSDPQTIKLWRRLVGRARRSMHSGAVVINPVMGRLGRLPSHRFTDGALRLQESGVSMRPFAGGNLYRLTTGPVPHPLPDQDMIALAVIGHAVDQWIQAELIPAELIEELKEHLARANVVQRGDTFGDMTTSIFDITRRLHDAFAGYTGPFTSSRPEAKHCLHFFSEEQAIAAEAALADRAITGNVEQQFRQSDEYDSPRRRVWCLYVTLPGTAPDPAHKENEKELINLAHQHDGAYAGWQRPVAR
ncbi:ribonuclease E inhibitor RraB [Actinoplanes sp. NPDC026619]|uniref:ribonuclease E inhibitor RraB n=1 Tax=Actinoplanes sp. NPDC026619 TaxID=3155798 RepID=UPI0033DF29EC